MNDRIKQLTRNYLDSLNLLSYEQLDENQKREIIRINGETEWIIFNASSLKARTITRYRGYIPMLYVDDRGQIYDRHEHRSRSIHDYIRENWNKLGMASATDYELGELEEDPEYSWSSRRRKVYGYLLTHEGRRNSVKQHLQDFEGETTETLSPENYEIIAPPLKEIGKEALKIYYPHYAATQSLDYDLNTLDCDDFNFIGGAGGGGRFKTAAIPVNGGWRNNDGKGDKNYWVAVDKSKMPAFGYEHNESTVCLNRAHWKIESKWSLNDLLNDPQILNSREQSPIPNSGGNNSNNTNTPRPSPTSNQQTPPPNNPPQPTIRDLTFTIDSVLPGFQGNPHTITLATPLVVENTNIYLLTIQSNDPSLQAGNQVIVRNVSFGPNQAEVDINAHDISIKTFFRTIELVPVNTPQTPRQGPSAPTFYPEVQQHNQDLDQEENRLVTLATGELLELTEKNNKTICPQAQALGLNLSVFLSTTLDYFQEEFFTKLDATQPLNSSQNNQITAANDRIRQKKLNIANNIRRIYNSNNKKLTDEQQKKPNGPSSPPPENELTKLKKQVIEEINQILLDPDNLRNIDLTTLENGKYQNWESEIEKLTTAAEVNDYKKTFVAVLQEVGVKEKGREKEEKKQLNVSDSSNLPTKNNNIEKVKESLKKLPLPTAKEMAKRKIRELFVKYKPDLAKIKEVWTGSDNWIEYLEKCGSTEEVVAFLENLEKAIIQQSQNRETTTNTHSPQNSFIAPFLIISFALLAGLILVVLLHRRRKKLR